MKTLVSLLFLVPSLVFANADKQSLQIATYQTVCLNSKDLTDTVDEFKEVPFVRGLSMPLLQNSAPLSLVIFVNPETKSYTIVEKTGEDTYCILAVGSGFEPVPKEIQDKVRKNQNKGTL